MKKHIYIFLILIILHKLTTNLFAQTDTTYIDVFKKKKYVQIYMGGFSRKINFTPINNGNKEHQISLSPNSSAFLGFILGLKRITLYGDITLPQTEKVNRTKTNVRAFSFFLSHFKNKWGGTSFLSYNKGLLMHEENSMMMYSNRNDLRKITTGVHIYHIFNGNKFSYIAANSQQMLQRKSVGSFIFMLTPSYKTISSSESIIPIQKSKYHLTGDKVNKVQLFSLQFKPGYAYNFICKNGFYFFAPSFYMGTGVDLQKLTLSDNKELATNMNLGYRTKFTTGINKPNFFITLEWLYDHTQSYIYKTIYKNTYNEYSINLGFRF